ncbi:WXG100 family type VII secretion target [Nocardia goodfellowii]|uniref:Uncharacterized protein YukE n=1 Tax=Nocardia goodfellowii TaxID=882446 RepID=A0ABS4Q6U0_9NOCA|nr:WXG100 family type VII secretion target [Nocardia goodfellowii]MBP2187399.1 uncharacterized protein YukE [Nocardia goodfellowii]
MTTSFTAAEAAAVVEEYHEAVAGIKKTIGAVQDTFDAARSGWEGAAYVAGQKASTAWQEETERINGKIDVMNQTIQEGNKTLEAVDPANVDALTNLI